MKLVIVESPAKSKTISHYLGSSYKVEASVGHVRDLAKTGRGGLGIDVDNNFKPTYEISPDKMEVVEKLEELANKADEVILATDPDREGEAIAYHLAIVLNLPIETTKRLEFHEITQSSIKEAIKHPRTIDMNLVHAQEARRIIDRIVGFKLSNLLQWKIKSQSAGRVQSVALKFIVDHEKEILNFKSEKFYLPIVNLLIDGNKYQLNLYSYNNKKIDNFKSKKEVESALSTLRNSNKVILNKIEEREVKVQSKEAFRTSTLQQTAYSKYGFSSKETARLSQNLYEGKEISGSLVGLITYIRTDSTKLSDVFVNDARDYIIDNYGEEYYKGPKKEKKQVVNAQDAHEAIRPTSIERTPESVRKYLNDREYKLYKLIYERTLASLMTDKILLSKTAYFGYELLVFTLKGSTVLFDGFDVFKFNQENFNKDSDYIYDDSKELPKLTVNKVYDIEEPTIKEDETKPPARYNEGKLIKMMEEKGIGRPSTYASTISTLLARDYVTSSKGVLTPTEQGTLTSNVLSKYFPDLMNAEYTAEMENSLDRIQSGEESEVEVIREFYYPFMETYERNRSLIYVEPPKETGEVCPNCGSPLVVKRSRYGEFVACSNYPSCKYIKKEEKEPLVEVGRNCPNCGSPLVYRVNKRGNKFISCSNFPKCRFVENDNNVESIVETEKRYCPNCGALLIKKRGRKGYFYGCSNYPNCDYTEPIKKYNK